MDLIAIFLVPSTVNKVYAIYKMEHVLSVRMVHMAIAVTRNAQSTVKTKRVT